jgi:quercetin dioxygenase-like cupin family protein
MGLAASLIVFSMAQATVPAVPGGCSEPADRHVGEAGCYLTAQIEINAPPPIVYWHILDFDDPAGATVEARRHRWSVVTGSHGRTWLHVLGSRRERVRGGHRLAVVGPLRLSAGRPVIARFIESIFSPGMRTRVHAHPGPEAFYVVEGIQCMETPSERRRVPAGSTYIVEGPHVQAAPAGRRNIAVVFHAPGEPWMQIGSAWQPSEFCFDQAEPSPSPS